MEANTKAESNEIDSDDEFQMPFQDAISIPYGSLGRTGPLVTTPLLAGRKALEIAKFDYSKDVLIDLGCGEGTFLIDAAKLYSIKGLGLDIEPEFIKVANSSAKNEKVEHLVTFEVSDFTKDFSWKSKATIAYIYGAPRLYNNKDFMKELKDFRESGKTVICYYFGIENWKYDDYETTFQIFVYRGLSKSNQ